MGRKWTKDDAVKLFELLVSFKNKWLGHPSFRSLLSRDENLAANQLTREATSNIAYRSVGKNVFDMTDDEFWKMLDGAEHKDMIEENAAVTILKMAEKFNITN